MCVRPGESKRSGDLDAGGECGDFPTRGSFEHGRCPRVLQNMI